MTHLLKPHSDGLASLDEVRAWMEAQAQETIEEKATEEKTTEWEENLTQWVQKLERTRYTTYRGETRTWEEWDAICKENNQRPITLAEIYHLARYRDATPLISTEFTAINEMLHSGNCNTLTGTGYDSSLKILTNWISTARVALPESGECFDPERRDDRTLKTFLDKMFLTNDSTDTMVQTLGRIVTNPERLLLLELDSPEPIPLNSYSPLILYSSHETPHIYKSIARQREYGCITVKL